MTTDMTDKFEELYKKILVYSSLANHIAERLDRYEQALSGVMPADFKDWWENSRDEWPEVAAGVIEGLRKREDLAWAQVGAAAPQPIPVSERLPEAEDCDAGGRCWAHQPHEACPESPAWELLLAKYVSSNYGTTHWLPAHALPLPSGEGE